MAKVIWSPTALEDIDLIAEYIARDSVPRARLFVERLIQATDRLQEFPQSGKIIPEIRDPTCREIIYGSFRIMYRLAPRCAPVFRSGPPTRKGAVVTSWLSILHFA